MVCARTGVQLNIKMGRGREREIERELEKEREREADVCICMCKQWKKLGPAGKHNKHIGIFTQPRQLQPTPALEMLASSVTPHFPLIAIVQQLCSMTLPLPGWIPNCVLRRKESLTSKRSLGTQKESRGACGPARTP